MEDTKVQIGDDCLLDLGVNSEWYISTLCYDNESVNVELRRKADRYSEWWRAEQTEPQTDGIIFKGSLKEGDYKLIKTTDGWVLEGEDIVYCGSDYRL